MNPVEASDAAERAIRPVVVAGLRRIGPEGRLRAACNLSESTRRLSLAGLRQRHPDWTDDQIGHAWFVSVHGRELADRYYAWRAARALRHAG